jgi:2-polyprenyl-6-methoxyphenol hydroxylase-like FAD-dependent oxidoreductase
VEILIAGAGIGGLTLAAALHQRGIAFQVLEQAASIDPIGAGLLLTPNATAVLEHMGLLQAALTRGRATQHWRILDERGCVLQEFHLPPNGLPGISIHRAALQELLLQSVPAERVRLGAAVLSFSQDALSASLLLSNGATVKGDGVVGADGLRSRVRAGIFGEQQPIYRGYVGWRGVAEFVPDGYAGILSESWGRGGRFGIAPIDLHRTYWYASANRPAGWTHHPGQRRRDLLEWFGDWHDPVARIIAATPPEEILCNDIADRPPRRDWSQGRVTLLGDAAHPMTPNLGQGACSAIEDAWVLARELGSAATVEEAFRRYKTMRYPRTALLQRQSLALGWVVQLEQPFALKMRRWMVQAMPPWINRIPMDRIFCYTPDADRS